MTREMVMQKLGYSEKDRLVIIHVDDVGMCQASVSAFAKLWEAGSITSGAVMTPCPWFRAVVDFCKKHPDVDMGVHATLTSEWDFYRWGAVSTTDPKTGMLDKEGYFPQACEPVFEHADPAAVAIELRAQIKKALDAGIDVTHFDSHMGAVFHPNFIQSYLTAALEQRIPVMQPRKDAVGVESMGATPEIMALLSPLLDAVETQGAPLIDGIMMMPLDQPDGQIELAKQMLSSIPAGVTHFIIHPAEDTPELRAICPDWPSRVANFKTFMSDEMKQFLKNENFHTIGYRNLRNIMRSA